MPWGVAVAAGISATAGEIQGAQGSAAAKKAAAPLTQAQGTLYNDAESIAATPYTAYTGQQVADLSSNQQRAVSQAADANSNNEAQDYINKAGGQADFIAGNQWNSATASKYMNPYTQDVTDIALKQENQAYANQENADDTSASSQGAFGGDRATLTKANTTGQHLQAQGNIEAEGQANAYNSALSAWQSDDSRAASAASAYQAAGNDITNMNSSQIRDLLATGGAQQAVAQMKLTTGYNNYLDQRNWATNQLAPLESAVGKTPTLAATQPTNYASDLMGVGSALAGYFGSTGTGNTASPGSAITSQSLNSFNTQNAPQLNSPSTVIPDESQIAPASDPYGEPDSPGDNPSSFDYGGTDTDFGG